MAVVSADGTVFDEGRVKAYTYWLDNLTRLSTSKSKNKRIRGLLGVLRNKFYKPYTVVKLEAALGKPPNTLLALCLACNKPHCVWELVSDPNFDVLAPAGGYWTPSWLHAFYNCPGFRKTVEAAIVHACPIPSLHINIDDTNRAPGRLPAVLRVLKNTYHLWKPSYASLVYDVFQKVFLGADLDWPTPLWVTLLVDGTQAVVPLWCIEDCISYLRAVRPIFLDRTDLQDGRSPECIEHVIATQRRPLREAWLTAVAKATDPTTQLHAVHLATAERRDVVDERLGGLVRSLTCGEGRKPYIHIKVESTQYHVLSKSFKSSPAYLTEMAVSRSAICRPNDVEGLARPVLLPCMLADAVRICISPDPPTVQDSTPSRHVCSDYAAIIASFL